MLLDAGVDLQKHRSLAFNFSARLIQELLHEAVPRKVKINSFDLVELPLHYFSVHIAIVNAVPHIVLENTNIFSLLGRLSARISFAFFCAWIQTRNLEFFFLRKPRNLNPFFFLEHVRALAHLYFECSFDQVGIDHDSHEPVVAVTDWKHNHF